MSGELANLDVKVLDSSYRQDKVNTAKKRFGFFVLLSNEVKDPIDALKLYRMRDVAEKAFWNYKDRLNLRRTLTSSQSALKDKLFVEFVAFIYLSYIRKKVICIRNTHYTNYP